MAEEKVEGRVRVHACVFCFEHAEVGPAFIGPEKGLFYLIWASLLDLGMVTQHGSPLICVILVPDDGVRLSSADQEPPDFFSSANRQIGCCVVGVDRFLCEEMMEEIELVAV